MHSLSKINLPDIMFICVHYDKYSYFGNQDVIQLFVKQKTPTGRGFLPVVFMSDNPCGLEFLKKVLKGLFYKDNFQLIKKDEIHVQMHGNNFFCGWNVDIPLIDDYVLPPGSILLEGEGKIEATELEMQYLSGYRMRSFFNGIDASVTYLHPSLKYAGPCTEGIIMRDAIVEVHPP